MIKGRSTRKNFKGLLFLNISLVIFFFGLLVFQVSSEAKESYLMQNYQEKIKELSRENRLLEINLSQENSLSNIEVLLADLSLEKANKVQYIEVLEDRVVIRK